MERRTCSNFWFSTNQSSPNCFITFCAIGDDLSIVTLYIDIIIGHRIILCKCWCSNNLVLIVIGELDNAPYVAYATYSYRRGWSSLVVTQPSTRHHVQCSITLRNKYLYLCHFTRKYCRGTVHRTLNNITRMMRVVLHRTTAILD